jgi:hypothetical protein
MNQNNIEEISTEDLALKMASEFSFGVEINTAKTNEDKQVKQVGDNEEFTFAGSIYEYKNNEYLKDNEIIDFIEYETAKNDAFTNPNTSYYSNLIVPGGTNYTENEIATPVVTPSIKGHAQFATDKGIGWFRSDDKENIKRQDYEMSQEEVKNIYNKFYNGELTQKQAEKIIAGENFDTKTRRILEVQSDLFQKWRNNFEFEGNKYTAKKDEKNVWHYYKNGTEINSNEYTKIWDTFLETYLDNADAFTKLLQKDNNWVTFFVKSIIQDSAKKGYEKVLFPSGDTASKIEGHETIEDYIKVRKSEIEKTKEKIKDYDKIIDTPLTEMEDLFGKPELEKAKKSKEAALIYLKTFEEELQRAETEGFGALKPIWNFYENIVTNILKKQEDIIVKDYIDEYGNAWSEVTVLNPSVLEDSSENSYNFAETDSGEFVSNLIEQSDWADMSEAERSKFKECN